MIKKAHQWSISIELFELINKNQEVLDLSENYESLIHDLKNVWTIYAPKNELKIYEGTIIKILNYGNTTDGFVESKDEKSYYFRLKNNKIQLKQNLKIRFKLIDALHKNKKVKNAILLLDSV